MNRNDCTRHSHALDKPQQKHGCQCYSMFNVLQYYSSLNVIQCSPAENMAVTWKTISGLCQCRCCTILVIFICHELPPPVLAAERSHDRAIVSSYRHIADICWPCLTILIRLYTYDYIRYTALHNSRSSYSYLIIFYIYNIHFKHVSPYDMRPFHAEVVGTPTTSPTSKSPWSSQSVQWTSAASCRSSATKRDLDAQTPLLSLSEFDWLNHPLNLLFFVGFVCVFMFVWLMITIIGGDFTRSWLSLPLSHGIKVKGGKNPLFLKEIQKH